MTQIPSKIPLYTICILYTQIKQISADSDMKDILCDDNITSVLQRCDVTTALNVSIDSVSQIMH